MRCTSLSGFPDWYNRKVKLIIGTLCFLLTVSIFAFAPVQKQAGGKTGTEQVTAEKLAKSEKEYKAAKAAFEKKPKDSKLKKAYVDSTVTFALGNMYSATLPPNKKYKLALQYFRQALKADPTNKLAKEQSQMIESIYKSMGKEVPK